MSFRTGHQIMCGESALQIWSLVFESCDILFSSKVTLITFLPGFLDWQHKQKKGCRSLACGYFSFRSVFTSSHTPALLTCDPSCRKPHMPAILKAKRMKKKVQVLTLTLTLTLFFLKPCLVLLPIWWVLEYFVTTMCFAFSYSGLSPEKIENKMLVCAFLPLINV